MVKWSLLIPNKRKEGHTLEWSKLRFVVRVCSHDFTQCHCTQLLLELLLEGKCSEQNIFQWQQWSAEAIPWSAAGALWQEYVENPI